MKKSTSIGCKLFINAALALSIAGCISTHQAKQEAVTPDHSGDLQKASFVEVDRYHVKFASGGYSFTEPKSISNGFKKIDSYALTKGVSFSVNQEDFSETILHKPSEIFSGKEDFAIDILFERVNTFIKDNGLPEQSITAEIIINGYADSTPFKSNTSGIASPISCDLGLLDAYVVDGKYKESVSYKIKRGLAIKDNRLLSLARSCYVLKKLQVRAASSDHNYFQRVSYSLMAHVNSQIRGVKINLKLRSPAEQ